MAVYYKKLAELLVVDGHVRARRAPLLVEHVENIRASRTTTWSAKPRRATPAEAAPNCSETPTVSAGAALRGLRFASKAGATTLFTFATAKASLSARERSFRPRNAAQNSRIARRSSGKASGNGATTPRSFVLKASAGSFSLPPNKPS